MLSGYANKWHVCQLENADPRIFGDMILTYQTLPNAMDRKEKVLIVRHKRIKSEDYRKTETPDDKKRRASALMDQLLVEIYGNPNNNYTDYNSATSSRSQKFFIYEKYELERKSI